MKKEETIIKDKPLRIVIRVGQNNLSFSVSAPKNQNNIAFEQYPYHNGKSVAANLREAFKTSELLQSGYKRALLLIDTPSMLLPLSEANEEEAEILFKNTYSLQRSEDLASYELKELNALAVFAINKDLKLVANDHFEDIIIQPLMASVWLYEYRRSFASNRRKVFVYFHGKQFDVFAFHQNRFKFSNTFHSKYTNDTIFYILSVWKQLGMDSEKDELHLIGAIENKEELEVGIKQFIPRCIFTTMLSDEPSHTANLSEEMAYDLKIIHLT